MSYHENAEVEEAKQGTIKAFIAAVVITLGMLCVLVYGIALMESAEKVNVEVYGAKHLERRIKNLEDWRPDFIVDYDNHTHRYHDGKIR